jgi:hypothetical protein
VFKEIGMNREKIRTAPVRARGENLTRFAEIFLSYCRLAVFLGFRKLTNILNARPYGLGSDFFTVPE